MSNYGLTLSIPITTAVAAMLAAYEDPATGVGNVPNVAGAKCMGIFSEATPVGASGTAMAPMQVEGIAPAIFGSAALINDSLTTDAQGRLVPASGAAGAKVWCVGYSRSHIAQAGDIGDVLIDRHLVVI